MRLDELQGVKIFKLHNGEIEIEGSVVASNLG